MTNWKDAVTDLHAASAGLVEARKVLDALDANVVQANALRDQAIKKRNDQNLIVIEAYNTHYKASKAVGDASITEAS